MCSAVVIFWPTGPSQTTIALCSCHLKTSLLLLQMMKQMMKWGASRTQRDRKPRVATKSAAHGAALRCRLEPTLLEKRYQRMGSIN